MRKKHAAFYNARQLTQIRIGSGRARVAVKGRLRGTAEPAEPAAVTVHAQLSLVGMLGLFAK